MTGALAALPDIQTGPAWLRQLREAGRERFADVGYPGTRDEEWRFTNIAPIARAQFQPARDFRIDLAGASRLADALRDGNEVIERRLGRYASIQQNPFVALNAAFIEDGAFVYVPKGAVIAEPIRLSFRAAEGAWHPRNLIIVSEGAQCTILESYEGEGRYLTNTVTEIVAGDNAVIDHYKIQREDLEAFHVATMHVEVGRGANFSTHSISFGGALVRNDVNAVLSEGSEATVNGLYLVNGRQHVDNHTAIDHAKPHGTSHELFKGILDGQASAVFNGKILVRKDAQKTDAKQTNKNLVLSEDAVINTKPELQIHADDVRCTHGATIGQLDAEAIFYLRSRGIGLDEARHLLTYAFAQDILDRVKVDSLREGLEQMLFERLHEHRH